MLLSLFSDGDDSAFTEIYNRHWKQVLFYAVQKTGNTRASEDIVQDVFVSLWKRRGQLEINSEFKNYLIVSVKYRVLRFLSRERMKRLAEEDNVLDYDILDDSTQQYLDFEELYSRLDEIIGELPEKSAIIYRMNKEQGMSHREIANETGMTEKAVNANLVRTKKIIRTKLNTFLSGFLL
ncbi:RNA polymerase sigma-70 factor, ECF subfamily [Pedobacter steynii]|uniref:RNA polymerase sigma-70 factor, ECF subfamily n=1 Tax=Pedobacter steynii TaxID=430522 RepID=A0A1G9Y8B6_9SPHI|nr:RNA polymerase sigma-70 factor, ECF subfamily [Pedobacter steynii]